MVNSHWQEISIPVKGRIVIEFDHTDERKVVGEFEYRVPVRFDAPLVDGIPTIQIAPEFLP